VPLRAGLNFIVRFNLILAVVGVVTARLWNPSATMDEVVAVIVLSPMLTYIAVRILGAGRSVPPTPAAVPPAPAQPAPPAAPATKLLPPGVLATRRISLVWLGRLMGYALVLILHSFGVLLAVPFYFVFGVHWAISYALFMAALMFALGVFTLCFVLSQVSPGLWQALKATAWPVITRLRPRPSS
jgi:hypothetical protein